MRLANAAYKGEEGVTLVELIIVIAIIGMMAIMIMKMYGIALISFDKSTHQSAFISNATQLFKTISKDIHEANQIEKATKTQAVISQNDLKIRYTLREFENKIEIIREIQTTKHSDWIQQPRFPVAEFLINETKPTITFKKQTPFQLGVTVSNPAHSLETTITCRRDF